MPLAQTFLLIIPSILALTAAQVVLKHGINRLGGLMEGDVSPFSEALRVISSPYVLAGLALYGVATILWIYALSRFDFNYIYPFMSLTFVLALLASWVFLGEIVPVQRWIGVAFITIGIFIGAAK